MENMIELISGMQEMQKTATASSKKALVQAMRHLAQRLMDDAQDIEAREGYDAGEILSEAAQIERLRADYATQRQLAKQLVIMHRARRDAQRPQ